VVQNSKNPRFLSVCITARASAPAGRYCSSLLAVYTAVTVVVRV